MKSLILFLLIAITLTYGEITDEEYSSYKQFGAAVDWINPCLSSPLKGTPTCDTSKTFAERAHDLVYNQETKASDKGASIYQSLSGNNAKAIPSLNITAYQWWSEALHGVANSPGVSYHAPIQNSTMFPQVITTGCTFNSSLFHMIGQSIATEARAMNNYKQAGLTFWAPNINIFRDPRWGRGQETPGEDPFLTSTYAKEFVSGMEGDDDKYIKASSCCKHYADYSEEHGRTGFNAIVNDYDQNDTYLVAFKYCAIAGNASGVMCSYNAENGIPSCANKYLMTNLLRDTWNFYGYITSDCGAVSDVQNAHHYTNNTGDTINDVFSAGMDVNCGGYTQANTVSALKSNSVTMATIQSAMYNLALVQMRLGMFDDISMTPWAKLGPNDVCSQPHLNLSLDASRQGMVLLKNSDNTLPLKTSTITSIALIGPNADNTNVLKGNYAGTPPFLISVLDGLAMYVDKSKIKYEYGVDINSKNASGIPAAVNIAKTADVTIMVMGLDQSQEKEGHDRGNVALPGLQSNLTEQVSAAAKGPVILVILSGGCVDISQQKANDKIKGIMYGGYPGMFGGEAVADVIFGTFNPTGRLDQTWYYNNFTEQVAMKDMNMRPNATTNNPGRGYRYFGGKVVYKFGDGMSYTSFTCSDAQEKNGEITVNIKNSGNISGGGVVLVYFVPTNGGANGVEIKRLIAFGRANMLSSGQEQQLNMNIYPEFLNGQEHKNMNGKYVVSCAGDM